MALYQPKFSAEELITATGGEFLALPFSGDLGIVSDSRKPCQGSFFIAIKGELFDGHDALTQAINGGAEALCIEKSSLEKLPKNCTLPLLLVEDSLSAYQNIARYHRLRFPELTVVALTGSVGKTSVKEMVKAVCISACRGDESQVLATIGNTNNHFGVPANLLQLTPLHRYAVIELGTSGPNEIGNLSFLAMPDVAVVNSIAACHLERLGSLNGVAHEKSAIFEHLSPTGVVVFPVSCAEVEVIESASKDFSTLRFGQNGSVEFNYLGGNLYGSEVELTFPDGVTSKFNWQLSGIHQASNAACASCVGLALGLAVETILSGLINTTLPGMRMNAVKVDDTTWILDAYNANPASMLSALNWLADFVDKDRLILVLGDMLELG